MRMKPWSILRTYDDSTVTLVDAQQTYTLPADFDRLVPNTFWDTTNDRRVLGGVTPYTWAAAKGIGVTPVISKRFQVRGTNIEFLDAIGAGDAGDTIALFYVSKNHCANSASAPQAAFSSNDDTTRLDDYLVELGVLWRFRRAKGLEWPSYRSDFLSAAHSRFAQDTALPALNLARSRDFVPRNIPEGNFPGA